MLRGLRKKASLLSLSSQTSTSSTSSGASNDVASYDRILKQVHDFEIALQAMDYLLDDRSAEGTALLQKEAARHAKHYPGQPAAIFPLAIGVMDFIEATLGFEPEVMARAHNTLTEAETASLAHAKYNTKHNLATSYIYPPGTEFQVTNAELTLLNALVMLLTENNGMVESAKALFKLRRAYQTLDAVYKKIKELEPIFQKNIAKFKKQAAGQNLLTVDLPGYEHLAASSVASLPQDLKLIKDLEKIYQMRKARIEGSNINKGQPVNLFTDSALSVTLSRKPSLMLDKRAASPNPQTLAQNSVFLSDAPNISVDLADDDDEFSDALDDLSYVNVYGLPEPQVGSTNESFVSSITTGSSAHDSHLHVSTIDEFIHLGVQLCFGILQVVLSLIPPAIGKVLSIVGFKGDRDTGLRMLWRTAITSRNIHGELALLCLLVFYDGPVQFVDVGFQVPSNHDSNVKSVLNIENLSSISDGELDVVMKNPNLYTPQILAKARRIFPHNALWLLQEGRSLASQGKLEQATDLMQNFTDNPENVIQMQQVKALLTFDRAMLYAFQHDFDAAARDFIALVDISSWTQGLYLFLAGSSYLAKYRMIKMGLIDGTLEDLKRYAELAEKYIKEAPSYVPGHGKNLKKGGIGGGNKQMPFDKFLLRKTKHIEATCKANPDAAFVDCVGTSPIHELIYFWNGYNRMAKKHLDITYKVLGYTGAMNTPGSANTPDTSFVVVEENGDEAMIRHFLQSITLRQLGRLKEGLDILNTKVIDKFVTQDNGIGFKFTKLTHSPYLYPTALYEKTMFVWLMKTEDAAYPITKAVADSQAWLKKAETVSDIGDYELSNRTSMRIKAAGDRLEQLAREA